MRGEPAEVRISWHLVRPPNRDAREIHVIRYTRYPGHPHVIDAALLDDQGEWHRIEEGGAYPDVSVPFIPGHWGWLTDPNTVDERIVKLISKALKEEKAAPSTVWPSIDEIADHLSEYHPELISEVEQAAGRTFDEYLVGSGSRTTLIEIHRLHHVELGSDQIGHAHIGDWRRS